MKRYISYLLVCFAFFAVLAAEGHPSAIPLVDLGVTLDEDALVYKVTVPTFALEPVDYIGVNDADVSLGDEKGEIEAFLARFCPVTVDGIAVRPILKSFECRPATPAPAPYEDPSFAAEGMQSTEPPALWMDAHMTLIYSLKGKPRQVSMVWGLFTGEAARELGTFDLSGTGNFPDGYSNQYGSEGSFVTGNPDEVVAVISEFGRKRIVTFSPDEPEYTWHSDGQARHVNPMAIVPVAAQHTIRVPLVPIAAGVLLILLLPAARSGRLSSGFTAIAVSVLLCAGVAGQHVGRVEMTPFWRRGIEIPDATQAKEIFAALHSNVYRAFDYETEDDIYDALAQSVSGALLTDIYNDVYQGLIMRDEGGAVCKIEKVEMLRSERLEAAAEDNRKRAQFKISCDWRVLGLVEHWGHAHRRVNEYSAVYTLTPSDERWKISGVEMNEQKRIVEDSL
jgi:hypothetical protein